MIYLKINFGRLAQLVRAVQTASNIQVRKKMYKGSSQQWKKYKPWLLPMFNNLKKN